MSRVHWRNQYTELEHASKFHNRVREIFATDPFFRGLKCYQEIAVSDLVEDYPHRSHRFDWYIDELHTVVELHGAQHYSVVNYGNIGYDEAVKNFRAGQERDASKEHAAKSAGLEYRVVHYRYYPKLDSKILRKLIL